MQRNQGKMICRSCSMAPLAPVQPILGNPQTVYPYQTTYPTQQFLIQQAQYPITNYQPLPNTSQHIIYR